MCVLISARGQYVVLSGAFVNGTFDSLVDAVASIRHQGKIPEFMWLDQE